MKVRIGVGLTADVDDFPAYVDALEDHRIDSLWLPELVHAPLPDPVVAMAHALARTTTLKVGTGVMVLPGRHPVLVAKQLATLARLAPGRVLPVFGLQPAAPGERELFPAPPAKRGALFDESMTLLRLLLTRERTTYDGEFLSVHDATIGPLPAKPLDLWLGGHAPGALRRIGRLADGWLASFVTPAEAAAGIGVIQDAAAQAGRQVDPEHFGVNVAVVLGEPPEQLLAAIRLRRPEVDPTTLFATGWAGARRLVGAFVEAGVSKFVVRPAGPMPWSEFLDGVVAELAGLQT